MAILSFTSLIVGAVAASAAKPPAVPLTYDYGGYPKIKTEVKWGTPGQEGIPTIFDTGSVAYWVYGPDAIINDGARYNFQQGPCNKSVELFYNWPKSKSHSKIQRLDEPNGYTYGGNSKTVTAPSLINDTIAFANGKYPAIKNNQVALSNFTVVTQGDEGCTNPVSSFDSSILGMAPLGVGGDVAEVGPSFKKDLFDTGRTESSSFSMWMDKAPADAEGRYYGTAIFGAVPPPSKYSGELVRLNLSPPDVQYVGYYVATPKLTTTSFEKPGEPKTISQSDESVKQCLLDSGTGQDRIPFSQEEVLKTTGLVQAENPFSYTAWNGSCDSIPESASLDYTFEGATEGKEVTISVPIRSYARGEYDELPGYDKTKMCALSLTLSEPGSCVFGAPFYTAALSVYHDDMKQIALAQGGVSTGSQAGPRRLGKTKPILPGKDIPDSV